MNGPPYSAMSYQEAVYYLARHGLLKSSMADEWLSQYPETLAPPTITSNGAGGTAAVSIAENTTAITTVAAEDPTVLQTVSYSIIGGADGSKFSIGTSTGALSFLIAPDYELPTDAG